MDFDERNALFDEAMEVMRGVWTTDDFQYEGRNFTATARPPTPSRRGRSRSGSAATAASAAAGSRPSADGWVPFPAPRGLAATARTVPLETLDDLRTLLDDLWRQAESAGRDPSEIDISFMTLTGGSPADKDFNPEAHLEALDQLSLPAT